MYLEQTKLTDSTGAVINPATTDVSDQIILLRRIIKLLEAQSAVDPQQRQRVTLDAISASLTLGAVTTVGTVTTVTTVTTVSSVTNIAALNGWNQQMFADPARNAYNTGIRAQLTFS
jgi:hypothetical protein